MPKRTKQKQRQRQKQNLTNIIKIAIGNRKREKREKGTRSIQPSIQRQPIIISQTPLVPNQPQQTSSSLLQNELINSRLDLLQNRLENKVLEAVNRLQEPTFRTGSSMAGPTPESLFRPLPSESDKPTPENLFGSDVPPYVPPVFESGDGYKPLASLSEGSPLSSQMTDSLMGGSAGGGGAGSSASTKPPKYDKSPLGSLTPGTNLVKSSEEMRQFLKDNLGSIPLIKGQTREKRPYLEGEIDKMQVPGLQRLYASTMRNMKKKSSST